MMTLNLAYAVNDRKVKLMEITKVADNTKDIKIRVKKLAETLMEREIVYKPYQKKI
jgi:hypothetical protein